MPAPSCSAATAAAPSKCCCFASKPQGTEAWCTFVWKTWLANTALHLQDCAGTTARVNACPFGGGCRALSVLRPSQRSCVRRGIQVLVSEGSGALSVTLNTAQCNHRTHKSVAGCIQTCRKYLNPSAAAANSLLASPRDVVVMWLSPNATKCVTAQGTGCACQQVQLKRCAVAKCFLHLNKMTECEGKPSGHHRVQPPPACQPRVTH
jgi:hypothetical protein